MVAEDLTSMPLIVPKSGVDPNENGIVSQFPELHVDRPSLTVEGRHLHCSYEPQQKPGFKESLSAKAKEACSCSKEKAYRLLVAKLPIVEWLLGYKFREWLVPDAIAGITVAIMHIPQGMAFALLAHVPAICGLYMAFYQSLIYAFFGTSKQMSVGSFAVVTLMTGKVVKELATFPPEAGVEAEMNEMNSTLAEMSMEGVYTPIQVATIVTFMTGVWTVLFGVLQLGSLSVFLSDMLVSGFTTGAAFHVLTSQVKHMLGVQIEGYSGPLKIIYTYVEIFKAIATANVAAVVIAVVTLVCLVINNEVLKPIISKYSKIPVPIELIAVIIGTLASFYGNFNEVYQVNIVGDIPTGLPPPTLPPLELCGRVAVDSMVIAIVGYTVTYSLAKIFAKKHDYQVDATQELYAQGLTNVLSSFFACPPSAGSLARALIQDGVGGVTQMASLICCLAILLVLLFIGPLFEALPNAVLGAVIAVALKGMFMQTKDMIAMWSVSRIDAIVWIITFLSVVVIDIDFGLVIGVTISLFILLAKNQRPTIERLGRIPSTDFYLNVKAYPQAKEASGMCLLRIVGPIHFANRENLKSSLVSNLDPKALAASRKSKVEFDAEEEKANMKMGNDVSLSIGLQSISHVSYFVIDMSGVSYIDTSGSKFLSQMRAEYEKGGVTLCLAGIPDSVLSVMNRSESLKDFKKYHLFHSLHDAVCILSTKNLFNMMS